MGDDALLTKTSAFGIKKGTGDFRWHAPANLAHAASSSGIYG
jgi:hypothetical protein